MSRGAGLQVVASLALGVAGAAALAQTDAGAIQKLDTVVVTSSRLDMTLREAPESMSLITRSDIDRMAPATGVDLFRQIPGLQIDQLGGPGGLSSVYIRGSDSNHVLVLVDGVRVNDTTNSRGGGFDLSNLDPSTIDHIEVLRGAASAVYGADAMGGVINIVTRNGMDATGTHGSASIGAGGQDYFSAGARVSAGDPGLRFSAGASKLKDGNDGEGGKLDLSQLSAASRWRISPSANVGLNLRHADRRSTSFPDDSGGIQFAQIRSLDQKRGTETTLSAYGQWLLDALTLNAALAGYKHLEDIDSPGVAPGMRSNVGVPLSVSHTDYTRRTASMSGVVHLSADNELALGAEYQREKGVNHTIYTFFGQAIPVNFDLVRNTHSAFAELKWHLTHDLIARAGLRYDSVDGNGSHTSPTLGLRYNLPTIDADVKASYSEGFKPPSFFALGLPVALGGNPDLRAERSKGGSLGYDQRYMKGDASVGVTLFKTSYTDLVTFDNKKNRIVNADQVDIHGVELESSLKASPRLTLRAHFTRLYSHIVDSNEPLRQRPGRRAGFQISWVPNEVLNVNWRTEYSALTFDSSIPTGNLTLPTYLRSDAGVSWTWKSGWSLSASVDNVFDKNNENYVGALAPGRRFRLSASVLL